MNEELPDPSVAGKEYRKTATIYAVQMSKDFTVETLEGTHQGHAGDWLAKGVKGELWPIAKDVFEKTYALVSEGAPRCDRTHINGGWCVNRGRFHSYSSGPEAPEGA